MQKRVVWLVIAITCCLACKAQPISDYDESEASRLFLRVYSSYGFLTKGSFQVPSSQTSVFSDTSFQRFSSKKKGLGAGIRYGAGIGYVVSRYVNLGVDAEYLMGSDLTSNSQLTMRRFVPVVLDNGVENQYREQVTADSTTTLSSKILSIIPQITFKAISTENFNIYTRVGLIVGIPMSLEAKETTRSLKETVFNNPRDIPFGYLYSSDTVSNAIYRYNSKVGIGYMASLGIQASLSSHLKLVLEITSNSLILQPDSYEQYTRTAEIHEKLGLSPDKYTYNQRRKIIEFTTSGSNSQRPASASPIAIEYQQAPKLSMTVNSLNVGLGIVYRF